MPRRFLVADLFCGAGGTSSGAVKAVKRLGAEIDLVAVNHWEEAIKTHKLNHPSARHYNVNLDAARPQDLVPEGYLDLLLASPECTHFSRARGGAPMNDQSRMSAWHMQRWCSVLDVRAFMFENVPEFQEWGPLCTLSTGHRGDHREGGRAKIESQCLKPVEAKKRTYFEAWLRSWWEMGYKVEYHKVNAADFGDATTRVRLIGMGRKDGRPIVWPDATHAEKPALGDMFGPGLQKWRAAREVIDWTDPGGSLFERKTPLSDKTMARIARGLVKFGGALAPLYLNALGFDPATVTANPGRGGAKPFVFANRNHAVPIDVDAEGLPTITTATGGSCYLTTPEAAPFVMALASEGAPRSTDAPLPTVVGGGGGQIIQPFLIGQATNKTPKAVDEPVGTVLATARIRMLTPMLDQFYGNGHATSVEEPVPTIPTKSRFAVVTGGATLVDLPPPMTVCYGPKVEARSVDDPMPTVTTKDRVAACTPQMQPFMAVTGLSERAGQLPRVHSVDAPMPTVTGGIHQALVEPIVVQMAQSHQAGPGSRPASAPLYTLTTDARLAVVNPVLVQTDQTGGHGDYVKTVDEPIHALTTKANTYLLEPVLRAVEAGEIDPRRLVLIDGVPYVLDLRYRMLKNSELAGAMGFDDEERKYIFFGTQTQVTKMIGNAVPVNMAASLIGAILGTMMPKRRRATA